MRLIDFFRKKKVDSIIENVKKKNIGKRYFMLIMGCLIVAIAFNLFFLRYNIVCFGISGLSIVLGEYGVNPSIFIFAANAVLLIISYFVLGKDSTKNQMVGSLIYPILIEITDPICNMIDLGNTEMVVIALLGGVFAGVGYGLIYKSNFSTGGTDVIIEILCKYCKISMGSAGLVCNSIIICFGKIAFSWSTVLYGVLVSYLISIFTDKVLLGISRSKAFYIVIDKDIELEVKEYLLSIEGVGTTVIDAEGGYSEKDQSLLLAVVPTRSYFLVKDGLREIDKNIFFLVCDSYEVSNKEGDLWY